jgi:hypothetical protein
MAEKVFWGRVITCGRPLQSTFSLAELSFGFKTVAVFRALRSRELKTSLDHRVVLMEAWDEYFGDGD